nr:MAG TPA_asm: hypothetical protein [Caudoviricetes sp.]
MFSLPHLRIIYSSIAMANGLHLLLIRLLIATQLLMSILKVLLRIHLIQRMRYILRTRHIARQKLHSCCRILKSQFLRNTIVILCGSQVEKNILFLKMAKRLRLTQLIKM